VEQGGSKQQDIADHVDKLLAAVKYFGGLGWLARSDAGCAQKGAQVHGGHVDAEQNQDDHGREYVPGP
jgi:hypothetical protein